ncbi:hypothetical protein K0M31_013666 [Melipona bicolor]|uniref:Uncharacterized protein n=1 Tax=Melipona bicolor TaxID=60889 RepID=A0AA40FHG7_9HYME|nr:hypothetical protein K0M31_013666 [Melipona bicolor]
MGELVHTSGLVESEQVTRTEGAGKRAGELRRERKKPARRPNENVCAGGIRRRVRGGIAGIQIESISNSGYVEWKETEGLRFLLNPDLTSLFPSVPF